MKHQTVVYYTFCSEEGMQKKEYKKYQRKIACQVLTYGFEAQFGIVFDQSYIKKGVHGKPFWAGQEKIYFNVSNTTGIVVCAVSDLDVGADTEQIRPVRTAVIKRCCTEDEIGYIMANSGESQEEQKREKFFQLWTLKESYIKMTGKGMYFPIKDAAFSIRTSGSAQEISSAQTGYFVQKRLGEYWLSLCTQRESEVVWKELTLEDLRGQYQQHKRDENFYGKCWTILTKYD